MSQLDLTPAARQMAALVAAVPDDALGDPTPCPEMTVGDLLDHIGGLSLAFTAAATKEPVPGGDQGPSADAAALPADWRSEIPARLDALAAAWTAPAAWDGMTMAGPIEMPAPIAALVTLDELVIHGWDLARATGQAFAPDTASLEAVREFVTGFEPPEDAADADAPGLFGPPVPVPAEAPLLDRVLGLTGRNPSWSPA